MELVVGVLLTAFVIVAAVMSLRQGKQNRGKSYEQKRDEMYAHYERRMEEFKRTELKERDTPKEQ